jgi:type VI protein secretion system component VasK
MTQEVKQEQEQVNQSETAVNSGDATSTQGKTYSQEDLNRMFADRARQAESAMLKKLGFESVADAEALIKEHKERKQSEMSALEKAQAQNAELQKQLAQAAEAQKALALQSAIVSMSAKLGIVDADAAFKLLDKGAIEFGDDGKPKNVEALLQAMLKDKPYLSMTGSTSPMNPGKTPSFTDDQIKKMTPEEINKNWDAISAHLERSRK